MIREASLVRPPIFVIIRASTKIDLKTGFCGLKTGFSRSQRQMRDHVTDLSFSRTPGNCGRLVVLENCLVVQENIFTLYDDVVFKGPKRVLGIT